MTAMLVVSYLCGVASCALLFDALAMLNRGRK